MKRCPKCGYKLFRVTLKNRYVERKTENRFEQYKVTSEPIEMEGEQPFVEAILLYDSEQGHVCLNEPKRLNLVQLLREFDITTDEPVCVAKTMRIQRFLKPERAKGETETVITCGTYVNGIQNVHHTLYAADPGCQHLIRPQPSGGIRCERCGGWYCA